MNQYNDVELGTKDVVWSLNELYKGVDDPAIEEDCQNSLARAESISRQFGGRVSELSPDELYELVTQLEELATTLGKLSAFAYLNFSTRVNDPEAGAFLQQTKEFLSKINQELVFFDLEWANVEDETAERLLSSPKLASYKHYLEAARRYKPHLLSEKEEKLLLEKSPVGRSSWINLFEKVMAFQRYGDDRRTQEEVLSDLYSPDRTIRKKASEELTEGLKGQLHIVTHTFNTLLADKMIDDRLRKYPTWLSSMNLANELKDSTVETLIKAVTSRYDIVERYYKLKKRLLGLDELYDYDRYAPLPYLPDRTIRWDDCMNIVLNSFNRFSDQMASVARQFFEKDWIHAPVVEGKTGGAFAHPTVPQAHPYVLVNYTGRLRDVETVAHELGHGVHQVLAAKQGYFNSHTPLTLAETASVFAEMLVFKDLMKDMNDNREKLGLAASKIESIFATVFRQIAMNRFEDRIHSYRREKGELPPEEFSRIWLETQQEMFRESVKLTDNYGCWWSYIGHFVHTPGYVYAYAFGELLVLSLYCMYEQGTPGFVDLYLELLSSGGNNTPYELLKPFSIDLDDMGFWEQGLDVIDKMVSEVEEMAG